MNREDAAQLYALGRDDLMIYSVLTDPSYTVNWHLKVIAKELENVEESLQTRRAKQVFLILQIPPRHGKSQVASINFPPWFIGRNPDKHIITASYSQELSMSFGSKARTIVRGIPHQSVFPLSELSEDSQAKDRWLTSVGGSYTSVGVGGTLTGFGAHVLLIDDPHKDRAEADSLHMRNRVWEWFRSTAYSRLEPRGVVVIIMQRWHKDDLVGRVLAEFGDREDIEIRNIKFPAIATEDEEYRRRGEAIWPDRYNLADLERIRGVQGLVNFSSQYQQEPIAQEKQTFKEENFRYFDEDDIKDKQLIYTTTVDLATGDKESKNGDFIAIITVGKEANSNNWYIVDCKIDKGLDPLQTCDYLFYLYKKYRMVTVGIETNAYQKTFKFWLTKEMHEKGVFMPLQEIKSKTEKTARIRGLVGYYQTGVIYHRDGGDYYELESQLLNFPQDKHDDGPDALTMQLEVLQPLQGGNNASVDAARKYVDKLQNNVAPLNKPGQTIDRNALLERYRQATQQTNRQSF